METKRFTVEVAGELREVEFEERGTGSNANGTYTNWVAYNACLYRIGFGTKLYPGEIRAYQYEGGAAKFAFESTMLRKRCYPVAWPADRFESRLTERAGYRS